MCCNGSLPSCQNSCSAFERPQCAQCDLPQVSCLYLAFRITTFFCFSFRLLHQLLHEENVIEIDECIDMARYVTLRVALQDSSNCGERRLAIAHRSHRGKIGRQSKAEDGRALLVAAVDELHAISGCGSGFGCCEVRLSRERRLGIGIV